MIIKNCSRYLTNNGLPVFWQLFVLLDFILSISIPFFGNSLGYHLTNLTILLISISGFAYQLIKNNRSISVWGSLFFGVILIKISIVIQIISFFGIEMNDQISFWIEQVGIVLVSVFALFTVFLFEKKFYITGLTTDLSLLILSATILFLLSFPQVLDYFLYNLDLLQYLLIIKILFSIILFTITVLIHLLNRRIILHNVVFSIANLLIIIYFSFELLKSVNILSIDPHTSWSIYHLSGVFILIFAFTEKVSKYSDPKYSHSLGSTLLYVASIFAVCAIPLSIFSRWYQDQKPIDTSVIGICSFILSSIVIWRLTIIIKNTKAQGKELKQIAFTDALTSLPNYYGLIEMIESYRLENPIVIAVNIDDFRSINDLYGRNFGDEVLISLARRLEKLPEVVIAARAEVDLFYIVYRVQGQNIHFLIKKIQEKLGIWDTISGQRIAVPLTFGVSQGNKFIEPQLLIEQTEKALSKARFKHNNYSVYYKSPKGKLPRHQLREILQKAIDYNYLPVHFQPIYNIEDGSLISMELLIRVQSKESGILLPGQFLEQAQSYGLLTSLTKICINMIAKHYHNLPKVIININLPSYMLDNPQILDEFLIHFFKEAKLPAKRFCIEVMEDQDIPAEHLLKSLKRLKKLGFTIAMDDFGTGFSSLSRLSMLPFDTVKIDRSLLLAASSGNYTILESAITLIKRLKLSTVVEGVETKEQLDLIRNLGADSVQGFLLSKPVDINKAQSLPLNAANIIAEF